MVTTARTAKRTQVASSQQRNKRQRDSSTPSLTLQHYFKKTSSSQNDNSTHNTQQQTSFESDLERAIALSLAESASTCVATNDFDDPNAVALCHDDAGTAHTAMVSDDIDSPLENNIDGNIKREPDDMDRPLEANETADDPFTPIEDDVATDIESEKATNDTYQQCPVCQASIKAESIDTMNEHINRCLDGEVHSNNNNNNTNNTMTTNDATKNDTKSWFRTMENAIRGVLGPKENSNTINNPATTHSSNDKPSSSSSSKGKQKRTCPFYKWVKGNNESLRFFVYKKLNA